MAGSGLSAPHFQNEDAAFDYVEAQLWPQGPVCPHCGEREKIGRLTGKTTRPGLRKCYACRKPFTVRIGSIFEDSRVALHLWLQVIHLMGASERGIGPRQIQRMLQCSMKTASDLSHRIRLALSAGGENRPLGVPPPERGGEVHGFPVAAGDIGTVEKRASTARPSSAWVDSEVMPRFGRLLLLMLDEFD